ncbi:tRNA uridine-5-carboxymethylaminomethyl(34) synthesis GTPase MnmE [Peptoniphilus sp. GNH]|nr:tRNA uridine-5-carboxymethylaminomethyl(34) synthesis GTPase MnmE [Peptoniphilus sp. GNH]
MDELIAAISTAQGLGGIGIVRMSGKGAVDVADLIFRGRSELKNGEDRKLYYGNIYDGDFLVDEVLIVKMLAPRTYTREDIVEIYCHGGLIPTRKILSLLIKNGARLAEPGEFTKRAFLNGRLDLAQAEAVIDLINSKTESAYENTIAQFEGKLSNTINEIREDLIRLMAFIVANVDFPDEDIEDILHADIAKRCELVLSKLDALLSNAKIGKLVRDGINTVILGRPNVGKSSFLNNILKEQRAIVTDIPGTTRDTIEEFVNMDGILLKISDTAGIRHTDDKVEKIGVERAKKSLDDADLLVLIFDLSREPSDEDREILKLSKGKPSIVIFNKEDLGSVWTDEDIRSFSLGRTYFKTSIKNKDLGADIKSFVEDLFFKGSLNVTKDTYVSRQRQINAMKDARESLLLALEAARNEEFLDLIEIDVSDALDKLGEIVGKVFTDDILDKVFSEFCIGK